MTSHWSFSELFFCPPTLNLKKVSRKSTNKKNLAWSGSTLFAIEAS